MTMSNPFEVITDEADIRRRLQHGVNGDAMMCFFALQAPSGMRAGVSVRDRVGGFTFFLRPLMAPSVGETHLKELARLTILLSELQKVVPEANGGAIAFLTLRPQEPKQYHWTDQDIAWFHGLLASAGTVGEWEVEWGEDDNQYVVVTTLTENPS